MPTEKTFAIKPISVTLSDGNKSETKIFSEIKLREPTVKEVMLANKQTATPSSPNLHLICMTSGLPMQVIENIKAADYKKLISWLVGFSITDQPDVTLPALSISFGGSAVMHDAKRYSNIIVEEPSIGILDDAMVKGKNDDMEMMLHLVADVGKVPLVVAEKLPISEFSKASKYLASFLSVTSSTE